MDAARARPQEVQQAVALAGASLACAPLKIALDFQFYLSLGLVQTLLVNAMVIGFMILLLVMINGGRNWARVTFLVLFVLGTPFFLITGPAEFARSRVVFLLSMGQIVLQACASFLLLRRRSGAYFRA